MRVLAKQGDLLRTRDPGDTGLFNKRSDNLCGHLWLSDCDKQLSEASELVNS